MWWDALAGGLVGTLGLIQSAHAAEAARQQQQAAIHQYQQGLDANNNALMANNMRNLYSGTGGVNQGVLNMGHTLGDALAGSGTYNSSATSSALANAQGQGMGHVVNSLQQAELARQQMLNQGQQNVAGMQLGIAGQNLQTALGQQQGAWQGVQGFIQGLAQENLAKAGGNAGRYSAPVQNGTVGQAQNMPGNFAGENPFGVTFNQGGGSGNPFTLNGNGGGASSWMAPHQQALYHAFMGTGGY